MNKKLMTTIMIGLMLVTILSVSSVQSRPQKEISSSDVASAFGTLSVGVFENVTGRIIKDANVTANKVFPYQQFNIPFNPLRMRYIRAIPTGAYWIYVHHNGNVVANYTIVTIGYNEINVFI